MHNAQHEPVFKCTAGEHATCILFRPCNNNYYNLEKTLHHNICLLTIQSKFTKITVVFPHIDMLFTVVSGMAPTSVSAGHSFRYMLETDFHIRPVLTSESGRSVPCPVRYSLPYPGATNSHNMPPSPSGQRHRRQLSGSVYPP